MPHIAAPLAAPFPPSVAAADRTHAGASFAAAVAALACAAVLAVSVRLFSVVKYESVIHEFDPYFNFRE